MLTERARSVRIAPDCCFRHIKAYDDELMALTREDGAARRLATIPGIGVVNATALLAAVGDASAFATGKLRLQFQQRQVRLFVIHRLIRPAYFVSA